MGGRFGIHFQKSWGWFVPKIAWTKPTSHTKLGNALFKCSNKNDYTPWCHWHEVEAIYDQTLKDMNNKKRMSYVKWTEEERYNVRKCASQNGIAAAARHYQCKCKNINESTVREFKNSVEKELRLQQKIKVILERKHPFKSTEDHLCWVMKLTKKFNSIETNIFSRRAITNQRTGNYKITPLTVQCRLQSCN